MNGPSKGPLDPELEEILGSEPDLLELARIARSREIDTPMAPSFEPYLRARLMDEAARTLQPRGLGRLRRALSPRLGLAGVGATAGVVMTVAAIVLALTQQAGPGGVNVPTAMSPIGGQSRVDPTTKAITISFNQPMDHASVVRALHIVPATSVTTSWAGDTLTITPTHGLSASTAYVVRIDNSVARSQRGVAPTAPIVVAFGTQPTPRPSARPTPPAPAGPPTLTPTVLATTGPAADLVPGSGGRLLVTDVTAPGGASSTESSSASSTTSSSTTAGDTAATTTETVTATSSSPSAAASPSGLVSFGPSGAAVVGATATAAAISPTGRYVAAVQPDGGGAAEVVVEGIDGSNPRQLARADAGSPVAWTQSALVLFVASGRLRSVDLEGGVRSAGGPGGLTLGAGDELLLAPGGRWAYLAHGGASTATVTTSTTTVASATAAASSTAASTSTGGQAASARLVDLSSAASVPLPASGTVAAFSPDGGHLAWADTATPAQVDVLALGEQLPATAAPAAVRAGEPAGAVSALAVSAGGSRIAATVAGGGAGAGSVRVLDPAGHTLGTVAEGATRLAFSGMGTVALVAGGQAATIAIPGPPPSTSPAAAVPADAQALLDRLVAAQTGGGAQGAGSPLSALPVVPGLDLSALTPPGATQGYVISVREVPNAATIAAAIRLLGIPESGSGADVTFADETVTLDRPDGSDLEITQLSATAMSPRPTGPHVVHVAATRSGGTLTVTVAFDSDLDPSTVAPALAVGSGRLPASAKTAYDADSRTATLTVPLAGQPGPLQPLTLTVSTALRDVDGDALSQPYTATVTVTG